MDINMPSMDGCQTTELIRELFKKGDLRYDPYICALTAYTTQAFKEKAYQSGMNNYLMKPISLKQIDKVI